MSLVIGALNFLSCIPHALLQPPQNASNKLNLTGNLLIKEQRVYPVPLSVECWLLGAGVRISRPSLFRIVYNLEISILTALKVASIVEKVIKVFCAVRRHQSYVVCMWMCGCVWERSWNRIKRWAFFPIVDTFRWHTSIIRRQQKNGVIHWKFILHMTKSSIPIYHISAHKTMLLELGLW